MQLKKFYVKHFVSQYKFIKINEVVLHFKKALTFLPIKFIVIKCWY